MIISVKKLSSLRRQNVTVLRDNTIFGDICCFNVNCKFADVVFQKAF